MHTVYLIYSASADKIYKGYTTNLEERLKWHNKTGNSWTSWHRPWTLFHYETYENSTEARKRENWYKTGVGRVHARELLKLFLSSGA